MMEGLMLVLLTQYSRSEWSFDGEPSYANLVWHGPSEKPTQAHLESLAAQAVVDNANRNMELLRQDAYRGESDPLFFKWQRGEASEREWLDKVAEIKARFPKAVEA